MIDTNVIKDYFKKKFQDIPKRITILNFNYYANQSYINTIVNEINGAFFDSLKIFCIDKRESINSSLQSLFNVNNGRRTGMNRMNELSHNLQNLMVNIDCTYKITGTSLTAFDNACSILPESS